MAEEESVDLLLRQAIDGLQALLHRELPELPDGAARQGSPNWARENENRQPDPLVLKIHHERQPSFAQMVAGRGWKEKASARRPGTELLPRRLPDAPYFTCGLARSDEAARRPARTIRSADIAS